MAGRARRVLAAASRAAPPAARHGTSALSSPVFRTGAGVPPGSRRWRVAGRGFARPSPSVQGVVATFLVEGECRDEWWAAWAAAGAGGVLGGHPGRAGCG